MKRQGIDLPQAVEAPQTATTSSVSVSTSFELAMPETSLLNSSLFTPHISYVATYYQGYNAISFIFIPFLSLLSAP